MVDDSKRLAGEATEEEVKELEDLLRTDPEIRFTIEIFYTLWNAVPAKQTEESDGKKLLERIREQNRHPALKSRQRKVTHQF